MTQDPVGVSGILIPDPDSEVSQVHRVLTTQIGDHNPPFASEPSPTQNGSGVSPAIPATVAVDALRHLPHRPREWLIRRLGLSIELVKRFDRAVTGVAAQLPRNPRVVNVVNPDSRAFGEGQHRVEPEELSASIARHQSWVDPPLDLSCDVIQITQLAACRASSPM